MLKALCSVDGCGFLVRVAAKPVKDIGPPHCPKHGAMTVDLAPDDDAGVPTVVGLAEAV
jgi:hypothetical protein